jgi:hypothetical protein
MPRSQAAPACPDSAVASSLSLPVKGELLCKRAPKEVVVLVCFVSRKRIDQMKRIALLVCGLLLLVTSTAEARRGRWATNSYYTNSYYTNSNYASNYAQPAPVAPASYAAAQPATVQTVSAQTATVPATTAIYDTRSAQGVANLMAAYNRVGHFGGNPGYEGCGCGASPAAAYNICCYGNSGMATVDVGYAQSATGMWYCCRRYR